MEEVRRKSRFLEAGVVFRQFLDAFARRVKIDVQSSLSSAYHARTCEKLIVKER